MNAPHLERRSKLALHRQHLDAKNVGGSRLVTPAIFEGARVLRIEAHQYTQREELRVLFSVGSHGLEGRGDGRGRKSCLGKVVRNSQMLTT